MAMAVAMAPPPACVSLGNCRPPIRGMEWKRSEISGTSVVAATRNSVAPVLRKLASLIVQPVASRVCELTGKKYNNARKISYSHIRTKKKQRPNLQYKRLWWERGHRFVKLRICTSALKTIDKKGLDAMAKEAGINLSLC